MAFSVQQIPCCRVALVVRVPQLPLVRDSRALAVAAVENLAGCRRHPGRGAEAVSHVLADRRNSPVSL